MNVGEFYLEVETCKVFEIIHEEEEQYTDTVSRWSLVLQNVLDEEEIDQCYADRFGSDVYRRLTDMEVLAWASK